MTTGTNDDYGKKFQLTDSLLKRLLSHEEYYSIKTIEPVIVVTDNSRYKQLKNPGYKHAAVTSCCLHVVNTPAKQESDLILSLPLENAKDVQIIHDKPSFLQGELQETAQHTRLSCKHDQPSTEGLILKATSVALISTLSTTSTTDKNDPILSGLNLNDSLSMSSNKLSQLTVLDGSLDSNFSKRTRQPGKLKKSKNTKNLSRSSHRPLPRPLSGTEKLNASYTHAMLRGCSTREPDSERNTPLKISPSRSLENLLSQGKHDEMVTGKHKIPRQLLSTSSHLSQSWNDILKAEHMKNDKIEETSDIADLQSDALNSSLSRFMKSRKISKENTDSEISLANRAISSASFKQIESREKVLVEEYNVDVFTVSKGSKLFNILEQSWIYSVIRGTLKLEAVSDQSSQRQFSVIKSSKKPEQDAIVQKFTQLKEEISCSTQYDELFLLTKELKNACRNYLVVKKCIWKSLPLLTFYVEKISALMQSTQKRLTSRMDELDVVILIGELFVSVFEDSEMISGRNVVLNDRSASFVKILLKAFLATPQLQCLPKSKKTSESSTDELDDLLSTWSDVCVSILFEIINAAKQSVWSCTFDQRSFDVTSLTRFLSGEEKQLQKLIDHIMMKLTSNLSTEWELTPTPSSIVMLYKSLFVLHFVCVNCAQIMEYVKIYYHEEIKYYISKEDNVRLIPSNYPVTSIITSFLPVVIDTIS